MKKYIKVLFSVFAIAALLVLAGCKDDDSLQVVEVGSLNPSPAYPLDMVSIEGSNLDEVRFVFVNSTQVEFQLDGTTLSFEMPGSTPAGDAKVTLAMLDSYRITANLQVIHRPIPVFQRITPSAAAPGEEVTIIGTSLDNLESVTVGGVGATVVSSSATELVFTVPDGLPLYTAAVIEVETQGGTTTSESIFYVGENLLANGELEEGSGDDFTNWNKFNGATLLTATTNADEAYVGRSLRAVGAGGDAWRTQFASDAAVTQVGVEYTLNVWIRAEAGTPGDGGNIRFSTTPNAMYSGNYDITSEWQQIEWVFTANEAGTQIVLDLGVIADAVYFVDNITLVATGLSGPQPIELLLNGGFEEGAGDDFTNWSKFNGADLLTATTNTDEVRNGDRALRAVGFGGDAWRTQMASDAVPTEIGVQYTASIWIKAEAGSPGDGGSVRFSTTPSALYSADFVVTTEWQKLEWEFTANVAATQLVLDLGATLDAVYFIDDASVLAPPED